MKYIKTYKLFEAFEGNPAEVKDALNKICEEQLAYIYDIGF